ncbi:hypothetical protein IV203_030963 [Nitzschia inconspicua]|uniref:Fe2OG dioxygenase domain-containing protein n=1 Tax=Nitzschia inconspicua TaxID=303405 RepID=A0A9K3LUM9_9STRA|nr:hypothetical protein IV203_011209 [Nitzschia inconspicua]KAG7368220.1 hypothetical protein IV203_030963 [Nitzschia inconspicua]
MRGSVFSVSFQVISVLLCMPSFILPLQIKENLADETETTTRRRVSTNAWAAAAQLQPPETSVTAGGEAEGSEWWLGHESLLKQAWKEWEDAMIEEGSLPLLNSSLIHPELRHKVYECWRNPTADSEEHLRRIWNETIASRLVFSYKNLLTEEGVEAVRIHLEAIATSNIPRRRPNGMNRYGVLLDPSIPGGIAHSPLHLFLDMLVNDFVRPLGRLFFPSHIHLDDDANYYAFTIRYSSSEDLQLKEHSDASVITLNLNLNLAKENYDESSIYFVTDDVQTKVDGDNDVLSKRMKKHRHELQFEPGMALLHRGFLRHGAMPISSGQRHNLVIWLYGKDGSVRFAPYELHEQLSREQRWSQGRKMSQCDGDTCSAELNFDFL